MTSPDNAPKFETDIFPAELNEISKRRRKRGLPEIDSAGKPSVDKGMFGLALSGGGIRSATFGLGVLQALIAKNKFMFIDYLSTVSGGGYIGSCISSAMNSKSADERQFENRLGDQDPDAIKHLRNGGNYLSPGGLMDKIQLPTTVLRGILLNLFLIVPALILAVFITEILSEALHNIEYMRFRPIITIAPFVFMVIVFSFISSAFRNFFTWTRRSLFERFLATLFALTIFVLCIIPTLWLVRYCVDATWAGSIRELLNLTELGLSSFKVILLFAGVGIFFLVIKKSGSLSKFTGKVAAMAAGILGPLLIFSIYLILCILFIESPYFDGDHRQELERLSNDTLALESERNELIEANGQDSKISSSGQEATASSSGKAVDAGLKRIINLFRGKGLITIEINRVLKIRTDKDEAKGTDPTSWKVIYWTAPSDDLMFDRPAEFDKKACEDLKDHCFLIQEKKAFFYIPKLSIFEAFKQPGYAFTPEGIEKIGKSLAKRMSWEFYLTGILIFIFNIFFVNINITSFHGFYRDRLSRVYIFQKSERDMLVSNDRQRLSDLNKEGSKAPYHLINTALNIPGSDDRNLRGRDSDFFTFSKHYCGSDHTGYCETKHLESVDPHINLGTAMAISGAAAAPNMGTMTLKQFVFVLTMLNIRLDYWAPNPRKINSTGLRFRKIRPNVGPGYLLKEALGSLNARGRFINVSDGGHIENLGVYQLLKRRCKIIIASDAEADPKMFFNGLVKLIRFAEIDMGITIDIDLSKIRNGRSHWTLGKICYGVARDQADQQVCTVEYGYLLYIKSSITKDENEYIMAYRRTHPSFPDETTADQFFDETQFECYRSLGEHIATGMLEDIGKYEDQEYREIKTLLQYQA